jgi:hypothetical protein
MRNLILHQTHLQSLLRGENTNTTNSTNSNAFPIGYWLDEFSKILCILDSELKIQIFSYENSDAFSNFTLKKTVELEMILGSGEGFEILTYLMDFVSTNLDNKLNIDITNSLVKLLIYKNEDESVHLVLESGVYIKIDTESEKYKIQNFFEKNQKNGIKILSAEISPNLEHILLVTSNFQIQLINYDFDTIIPWNDLDDLDGTNPQLDNNLCQSASVSWRGDSSHFCVLYSINGGRKCLVRDTKFNIVKGPARADNKVVFSTAEGVNQNLSNVVSWQPSGSLIAYFQEGVLWDESTRVNHSDRAGVLFSEKNCLRHGEFWINKDNNSNNSNNSIPNSILSAKFLKWNMDMPLLAVYFDSINLIAIYHRSNYEWSLKYSYYLNPGEKLFSLKFSDALSLRIYSLFSNGKFSTMEFKFEYQNSLNNYNFADNNGTVSVVSGRKIKLTPLGVVNIPPPLCYETVKIGEMRTPPYLLYHWRNLIFVLSHDNIDYIVIDHQGKKYSFIEGLLDKGQSIKIETKFVKNFIFTTNEDLTIGYFVIIKSILDNDHQDELITLEFDIKFNNTEGMKFLKFNKQNSHRIDRCIGVFNSMLSEELYDKNYYKNRENLILSSEKDEKNNNSKKENENKNTNDEDDLFFNLVGMSSKKENNNIDSFNNKNLNFEDFEDFGENSKITKNPHTQNPTSKYFYIIQQQNKEKSFKKITLTSSHLSIEDTPIFTSFDILKSHSIITRNNEEKIIYLTKNNRLFLNNTLLALDITSFEYFKHFLLFTQSSNTPYNTLHIIDLSKKDFLLCANKNNLSTINPSQNDEGLFVPDFNYKSFSIRTLERSSLIVAVSKVNLVLQMSRGNLETIYPRLLVLNLIVELIYKRDYRQAFELVRKHKINTNFIYDTDPEGFLNNIPSFIQQVEKSDYINLFLNGLENSLCEEMLQIETDNQDLKEDYKKLYINNKINKICDEMRKHLLIINKDNKYLTSILHTHTKKSPPEYLPALKLVQNLKISEKNKLKLEELVSGATKPLHGSADKALEYLCWVVNADTLFDFALKTYDFELVIMVAKHTQKDPKEFLPYLKKLQDLSEQDSILMKYQVNMDLKNYDDALYELSQGEGKYFDKCVELINKYELYEQSFKLFSQENLVKSLYKFYGDYLRKKDKAEAAWAYLRSGKENYEMSLKCFVESGNVNGVMTVMKHIINGENYENGEKTENLEKNENSPIFTKFSIFEILSELIDTCTAAKKISDLEKIYLYILENESKLNSLSEDHVGHSIINVKSKIMDSLIRSKKWKSAYLFYIHEINLLERENHLISHTSNSSVLKECNILREFIDGINLSANLQINELKKNLSFFEEKYRRLLKVQHLKRTQPHLFILDPNMALEDNVSDSGSVVSGLSNLSNTKSKKSSLSKMSKSSKNSKMTKKSKNKIAKRNVKEGSPLEEEFLITILEELKLTDEDIENFRELVRVLNFIKNSSIAEELGSCLKSYIENVNTTVKSLLSVAQQDFINTHPEIKELFPGLNLSEFYSKEKVQGKSFKTTSG